MPERQRRPDKDAFEKWLAQQQALSGTGVSEKIPDTSLDPPHRKDFNRIRVPGEYEKRLKLLELVTVDVHGVVRSVSSLICYTS